MEQEMGHTETPVQEALELVRQALVSTEIRQTLSPLTE
jgi:hypothetical protein